MDTSRGHASCTDSNPPPAKGPKTIALVPKLKWLVGDEFKIASGQDLTEYERDARKFHEASVRGGQQQYLAGFLCGVVLQRAKEIVPHGKFEAWKKKSFPDLSLQLLSEYQKFAEIAFASLEKARVQIPESFRDLKFASLTEFQVPTNNDGREQLLGLLHEVTDGKTITSFMRLQRLARQPKQIGGDAGVRGKRRTKFEIDETWCRQQAEVGFEKLVDTIVHWKTYKLFQYLEPRKAAKLHGLANDFHAEIARFEAKRKAMKTRGGAR